MTSSSPSFEDARTWRGLLAAVAIASAAPLLVVRYLPFTDLPEHVAAIATTARLLPGGGGSPDYVLALGQSQYLVYDLVGAVFTRLLVGDANLANRLCLAIVAVAWPYAMRSLLRALDRDERVALLAPAVFWSRALTIGFLPFVASMPLAVYALAVLVRHLKKPTRKRGVWMAIVALVLFYTHVSSFVVFTFAGAVMTLVRVVPKRDFKTAGALLLPMIPSLVAALAWWHAGSLARNPGEREHVGRLPGHVAVDAVPIWAFDIWRSHVDELWSAVWWIAFSLIAIAGLRRRSDAASLKEGAFALVPLVCALVVYVVTPFHVGAAGYLDVRLAPMLALFVLPLLRPVPSRLTNAALVLATIGAAGGTITAVREMTRVEHEMLGDFDGLLAKMKPHTRLAMLNFEQRSPRVYFWPYVFAGAYHRQKEGTITSYSFNDGVEHWPIHYAPDAHRPPSHPGFWVYAPCVYEFRRDGLYFDYLLVQGPRSPFDNDHPGPEFREIGRSGGFILYEKISNDDPLPDIPDRGPCAPWIGPPPPPSPPNP
jgi:hypothetical protein